MARIDTILKSYDGARRAVIGTVVDLEGSGYRRPGARILIEEDGEYRGAISGGCLERDVVRAAWNGIDAGAHTVLFDTRANEFFPRGQYGTGCDGIVQVLLRPLPFGEGEVDLFHRLLSARDEGVPLVVAHVYDDTADALVGAAAVWSTTGCDRDTAFPGLLADGLQPLVDDAFEARTSLGATIRVAERGLKVLVEFVPPPTDLLIFGSGADARALAEVAEPLGWRIRVASTDPIRLRNFDRWETVQLEAPGALEGISITPFTAAVMMTHSLEHDLATTPSLLESPAAYVGLLGPRRRAARLFSELHEKGRLPRQDALDRLHAPIGLDIGGDDPWEVATSIVGEIIAASHGRDGGALSDRRAPIHDPHELRELVLG